MTELEEYQRWVENADAGLQEELARYADDEKARHDAFYQELSFGTAGLRGVIGAGPNRMNFHTVGKATQGLADYLNANYENPAVAIARDSRNMGKEFCELAAGVLAANGIRSYLYERIEPTPALSFAVRDQKCQAGICMTASHNPAPYNGYKVYGPDGCQITTQAAKDIQFAIGEVDIFEGVKSIPFSEGIEKGLIAYSDEAVLDRYIDAVAEQSTGVEGPLKLVYTPLHGAGLECVTRILDKIGVTDVVTDPEQSVPNGNFPTCPYPNPEFREALEHSLALCDEVKPDLLVATDPDTDRVGIAVPHEGEYVLLSGNEVGVLLTDYLCEMAASKGADLRDKVVVSTIVSSAMLDALAAERGFELRRTLTGFKYIGEQIGLLESEGAADRYLFGFEESYGYLAGTHARDKDAVVATMVICEMARWYRGRGMDLVEGITALYNKLGYYKNATINLQFPGAEGAGRMVELMDGLRNEPPSEVAGLKVLRFTDYASGAEMPVKGGRGNAQPQTLPGANVLQFDLENDNILLIRPSGTEPKIKAYLFARGADGAAAEAIIAKLDVAARELLS